MNIILKPEIDPKGHQVYLSDGSLPDTIPDLREEEREYIKKKLEAKQSLILLNRLSHLIFILNPKIDNQPTAHQKEAFRKIGFDLFTQCEKEKVDAIQISSLTAREAYLLDLLEGFLLSTYRFNKYKSEKKTVSVEEMHIICAAVSEEQIKELENIVQANFLTRDLVNEPLIYLTATKMSEEIMRSGKEAGFHVEVFHKAKIESLGMNGLLAVNKGSVDPPTFSVIEYKPENARNNNPVVLVGKGVVYDTGGLSLKPTANSMDYMKCDMAGAATVIGTLYAIAKNKLPIYAVGLIPATDNRPGGNAITPGDVIEMMNGKSVEIKNTDAEGRLILADALVYAKRYQPDLVIDLATLTGSAVRAIGHEAMVMMGTADSSTKEALLERGEEVYERMVEFPLWEEYGEQLKSDIADITNLGGATAGAITAGKFLEHFTDYPWIHLDIAGTAYYHKPDQYRGKNGTGIGVRLLYNFIKKKY